MSRFFKIIFFATLSLALVACPEPTPMGTVTIQIGTAPTGAPSVSLNNANSTPIVVKNGDSITAVAGANWFESGVNEVNGFHYAFMQAPIEFVKDAAGKITSVKSNITVVRDTTLAVHLQYGPIDGKLTLSIPAILGGTPSVVVTGPNGFSQTITSTQTLGGLLPGDYTITPANYAISDFHYQAPTQTVKIVAGTVQNSEAKYAVSDGKLAINIVPMIGGTPSVVVTGPNGFSKTITATETLVSLAPGDYTLTPNKFAANDFQYASAVQTIKIAVGTSTTGEVRYAITDGKLAINIVPVIGGAPSVVATGPNGFSKTITDSQVLAGLPAGDYTVVPTKYVSDGYTYMAAAQTIKVAIGSQADASISYAKTDGKIVLSSSGPNTQIRIVGPSGYDQTKDVGTVTGLAAGNYVFTLPAGSTQTIDGKTYRVTISPDKATLAVGNKIETQVVFQDINAVTGSLPINLNTPTGTTASVTVTGPNGFTKTVSNTSTLSMLEPGVYTITPTPITLSDADGFNYKTTILSSTVVKGQVAAAASVTYTATDGKLNINISGVPIGSVPSVKVTGPDGKVVIGTPLSANTTLANLVPGAYTITPDPIAGQYTYTAASTTVTVVAGLAVLGNTTYAVKDGRLNVSISGLPIGAVPSVKVTGPDGKAVAGTPLKADGVLAALAPGIYTIAPDPVTTTNKFTYTAPSAAKEVVLGQEAVATPVYAPTDGQLTISMTGVADGSASITVTGPNAYSYVSKKNETIVGLAPGSYTIAPASVTVSGFKYTPAALVNAVTVVEVGNVAVAEKIVYQVEAKLKIIATGLPTATSVTASLNTIPVKTTPLTFAAPSQTLSDLQVGDFIVTGSDLTDAAGYKYSAAPVNAKLVAAQTTNATLAYAAVDGQLNVTVNGLPTGTNANVTVTGPNNYSKAVTASGVLTGLVQGAYTITSANVLANNATYVGNNQSVNVALGAQAAATVTYEAGTWLGAVQFISNDIDTVFATKRDGVGNIYVAGETTVTKGARAQTDIYLNKYKADGTKIFSQIYGTEDTSTTGSNCTTAAPCYFDDSFVDMFVDAAGNIAIAIRTQAYTKTASGGINYGTSKPDVVTLKYKADGTLAWPAKRLAGTPGLANARPDEYPNAISMDKNGNVIVVGGTRGNLSVGAAKGGYDSFVVKYSTTGAEIFKQQFGTTNDDDAAALTTDALGNIIVAGSQNCSVTTNTTGQITGSAGTCQVYIKGFTAAGLYEQAGQLNAIEDSPLTDDEPTEITIDSVGNVIVAGRWNRESVGFGPGEETRKADVFVAKYSNTGTKVFHAEVNGSNNETVKGLAVDIANNIVLTGTTDSSLSGNINAGGLDSFVVKYDPSGVQAWLKQFGGAADDSVANMAIDSAGAVVISGATNGDIDGPAGLNVSTGLSDAFLAKIDTSGAMKFIKQFGTTQNDAAVGVNLDSSGDIVVVGKTAGDMDGTGPGVARAPFYDTFMWGFDTNGNR